jgi:hypothetical protein
MKTRYTIGFLVALYVAVAPENHAWSDHDGRYAYVGGERQRQGRVDQIEVVVSRLSIILRSFARERLLSVCKLPQNINISTKQKQLGIALIPLPMRWTSLDGNASTFLNVRGRKASIRRLRKGRTISEVVSEGRSQRLIDYRFNASSARLDLRYTIRSPYLPQDVVYSLSYAKTGPARIRQAQR